MNVWLATAIASGALFALVVSYFAWVRIPRWEPMSEIRFLPDFAKALRLADRVQPTLAVIAFGSTIAFGLGVPGASQTLTTVAAICYGLILIGSGLVLVPIQRGLIKGKVRDPGAIRARWFMGHRVRTALGIVAVALMISAGVVDANVCVGLCPAQL
jgi:hypothetical protein